MGRSAVPCHLTTFAQMCMKALILLTLSFLIAPREKTLEVLVTLAL